MGTEAIDRYFGSQVVLFSVGSAGTRPFGAAQVDTPNLGSTSRVITTHATTRRMISSRSRFKAVFLA